MISMRSVPVDRHLINRIATAVSEAFTPVYRFASFLLNLHSPITGVTLAPWIWHCHYLLPSKEVN